MNAIKPIFPSDPNCSRPDKKAILVHQGIDWDSNMNVTCNQTWRDPDGTEYELELMLKDGNMEEGEVIACSVDAPSSFGFGGVMAISGIMPAHFPMPSTLQASGVASNSTDDAPTLEEVEGETKDDKVKGMNYDFTDTGLMNKEKKLK
jgi:hypothetical protein